VCTKCGPATTTVTLTKPYDGPQPTGGSYVPEKPEEETYVPEKPEEETYVPEKPEEETYVPEKPEEYNTKHATSTVVQVITLTKVPIPATSAPGAPYVPANSTNVYAPTGSTSSTGYGSYPTYIPSEFEGAASRFSVGMSTLGLLVAAVLAM
jgi:chitinase